MILFIKDKNQSINFDNAKSLEINDDFSEFLKLNLDNFNKKSKFIIIDDLLINSDEEFEKLKEVLKDKLILFTSNTDKKFDYEYYLLKNDSSYHEQLEKNINSLDIGKNTKSKKEKELINNLYNEIKQIDEDNAPDDTTQKDSKNYDTIQNQDIDQVNTEKEKEDTTAKDYINNDIKIENNKNEDENAQVINTEKEKNDEDNAPYDTAQKDIKNYDTIQNQDIDQVNTEKEKEDTTAKDYINNDIKIENNKNEDENAQVINIEKEKNDKDNASDDTTQKDNNNDDVKDTNKKQLELLNEFNNLYEDKKDDAKSDTKKISNKEKIKLRKKELQKQLKNNSIAEEQKDNKDEQAISDDTTNTQNISYDKEEKNKKDEKLKSLLSSYTNLNHIDNTKLDEMIDKNYKTQVQQDNILKLNNSDDKAEKGKSKKFDFNILKPKFSNTKKVNSSNNNIEKKTYITTDAVKGEIAVTGGLKGVGTTFCCFKIAEKYNNFNIGYIQYKEDELEISILKKAQEDRYIKDNIAIYQTSEKLKAYQDNDIVIVDYGYFDKSNTQLLIDFERASNKYFVVNNNFNKYTSINNALSYSYKSKDFTTIFNMYDEKKLINLQKEFRELKIIIFGFEEVTR